MIPIQDEAAIFMKIIKSRLAKNIWASSFPDGPLKHRHTQLLSTPSV